MSAGLLNYDWMMSVKERPWHGIGTVVNDAPTSDEAIRIAKLDWQVSQEPIFVNGKIVEGVYANVRSDTQEVLGIVKNKYRVYQNDESFRFVDSIVGNKEVPCRYETCGSLFDGRRVFMLVKLPNHELVGDDVENYLFFTNSHDGSSSFMAGMTNVRVVCNNTLQMAVRGASRMWKCKHTDSIKERVDQAREALGLAVKYLDSIQEVADDMANKQIDATRFFETLRERNILQAGEKTVDRVIGRIQTIYEETDNIERFRGTAWGMYNAVADYVSNSVPLRRTDNTEQNRLVQFFDGSRLLHESQRILMSA